MINKTPNLFKIKNSLKLMALSTLLLGISCSTDEGSDSELEFNNANNLSSKSVELDIINVSASTEQSSNPASNSIDNDEDSRWSGYGDSVDLILDLGSNKAVDYIKISYYNGNRRQSHFNYYYSTDGDNWIGGKSKTSSGRTTDLETFDLENISSARYIKLEFEGTSTGLWNSILDIEVYGSDDYDYVSIPSLIQAEDYASQSGIRTERTSDNDGGKNVGYIDEGDYLVYNIDVPNTGIYKIDFRVASKYNDSEFDVYEGNDLVSSISKEVTGGWQTWKTTSKNVTLNSGNQNLKIVATNGGWNLNWIEFTLADGEINIQTEIVDILDTTAEDILGDFWKITVPVDEDGDSSPLDCSEYDCRNNNAVDLYGLNDVAANNNYSDYFYVNDGWAVFTAFCGGATTVGSQYPRSELRGLNEDGDDDYFDMQDHQELQVTVKVLEVPTERPEVNMVQIHGPDDEPLRVEYNDGSTGSDQGLHLTVNEDSTLDDVIDYEIGQELKVWVKVEDGHLWIALDNLSTGDKYETSFEVEDETGYWKVGCYLQSSITYCDVKSSGSFCSNGGQSDDYYATGSVAAKDLTLIRDGKRYK